MHTVERAEEIVCANSIAFAASRSQSRAPTRKSKIDKADPVLYLIARHRVLLTKCPKEQVPQSENIEYLSHLEELESEFLQVRPTSMPGAIAALRHALAHIRDFDGLIWPEVLMAKAIDFIERRG
jgi:hypothetical protein